MLKKIKKFKHVIICLCYFIAIIDSFFLVNSSDFRFFGTITIYVFIARSFKVDSRITFIFCLVLLFAMFLRYLFFGPDAITEELAVWLVLFFASGIFLQWKELKK
jgi:hypothetical protein